MQNKGFRYTYAIVSKTYDDLAKEIDAVGNAYQYAGWHEVEIIPDDGFPTHIVFEWLHDSKPMLPIHIYF